MNTLEQPRFETATALVFPTGEQRQQKTLPRYITADPDGFYIRITRAGITHRGFVGNRHPDALERAIALRDEMMTQFDKPRQFRKRQVTANSNTGHVGISEKVTWNRNHPYHCYSVSYIKFRNDLTRCYTSKNFFFNPDDGQSQATALARAIAFRTAKMGPATEN